MGISLVEAPPLFSLSKFERLSGDVLCLGRPAIYLTPGQLLRLADGYQMNWSRSEIEDIHQSTFAEPLLKKLGFGNVRSMDVSDYENAEVIHDLNVPVPKELENSASFIYGGGTIEHVFDVATALSNIVRMLRVGGTVLLTAPANGSIGHGFYQFSPELFYRYFEVNGFDDTRCYLVGRGYPQRWYRAIDPKVAGQRIEFQTMEPTEILVIARKSKDLPEPVVPQQSDYAEFSWKLTAETSKVLSDEQRQTSAPAISKLLARTRNSRDLVLRQIFGIGMPGMAGKPAFEPVNAFGGRF